MGSVDIPVLSRTAAVIEELRELEDAVDAHLRRDRVLDRRPLAHRPRHRGHAGGDEPQQRRPDADQVPRLDRQPSR
jgi:hypothetical protein